MIDNLFSKIIWYSIIKNALEVHESPPPSKKTNKTKKEQVSECCLKCICLVFGISPKIIWFSPIPIKVLEKTNE